MPQMRIWRRVSGSNQSQSVRTNLILAPIFREGVLLKFWLELELDEEGTRISLTIVDTPGFGDQIDNEARFVPHFPGCGAISALTCAAFLRLSDTLSVSTMTFLLRNRGSSATQDSGITVFMLCSISSPLPVTGQCLSIYICILYSSMFV